MSRKESQGLPSKDKDSPNGEANANDSLAPKAMPIIQAQDRFIS